MKNLLKKVFSKEVISYLIFGVLTTIINLWLFAYFHDTLGIHEVISSAISQIVSIIFAYITNKLFVFESRSIKWEVLKREIPSFFGARAFTLVLSLVGIWFLVSVLGFDAPIALGIPFTEIVVSFTQASVCNAVLSVVVIVLNYLFSKFFIFKKDEQ